jgi:hypothetical protein
MLFVVLLTQEICTSDHLSGGGREEEPQGEIQSIKPVCVCVSLLSPLGFKLFRLCLSLVGLGFRVSTILSTSAPGVKFD